MHGDADFAHLSASLPTNYFNRAEPFDSPLRPSNFPVWREAIAQILWPNPGRYEALMDLLQGDPTLWLYFSR
jgi:hypothetical protein